VKWDRYPPSVGGGKVALTVSSAPFGVRGEGEQKMLFVDGLRAVNEAESLGKGLVALFRSPGRGGEGGGRGMIFLFPREEGTDEGEKRPTRRSLRIEKGKNEERGRERR